MSSAALMIKLASRWAGQQPSRLTTNTTMISAAAIGSFSSLPTPGM